MIFSSKSGIREDKTSLGVENMSDTRPILRSHVKKLGDTTADLEDATSQLEGKYLTSKPTSIIFY